MKNEWLVHFPIEFVVNILEAMNRPLDSSIKPERDSISKPEIEHRRFNDIQEQFRLFLDSIAAEEAAASWSALTQLRASLDRASALIIRFENLLVGSVDVLVEDITACNSAVNNDDFAELLPDALYPELVMRGPMPTKINNWSLRSAKHPKSVQGASPRHLIAFVSDALQDIEDACVTVDGSAKTSLPGLKECFASVSEQFEQEEFLEALRLAAINRFIQRKLNGKPNEPIVQHFLGPACTIKWMIGCIDVLTEAIQHLRRLIGKYKRLSDSSPHPWLNFDSHDFLDRHQADWPSVRLEQESRMHLAAFLKDGRRVKPDTIFLRSTANIYSFIFGKPFNLNMRDAVKLEKELGNAYERMTDPEAARLNGVLDYEINEAMKFACVLVRQLKLEGIIERADEQELGYDSSRHSSDENPTTYDIKRHQRSFWHKAPSPIADFNLVCKFGDLWKRDRQRKRSTSST